MTPQEIKNVLKLYRTFMTERQRASSIKKASKNIPYPLAIEREYARIVTDYQMRFATYARERVMLYLPRMLATYRGDAKLDGLDEELAALEEALQAEIVVLFGSAYLSTGDLARQLEAIAVRIFGRNHAALEKQLRIIAGTPIVVNTPWLDDARRVWARDNYRLIKNLSTEHISKINTTVLKGLENGKTLTEITDELQKISDKITGARARLIARDQVGKFNSIVTEKQFLNIGMDTYIWRTAQDEKVRGNPLGKFPRAIPSHFVMDDVLCTWADASMVSLDNGKTWVKKFGKMESEHVGRAVACRCIGLPAWADYIPQLDREAEAL